MTTAILLSWITGSIVISMGLWCLFLVLGFRWIRFADYTRKKLVVCALLVFVINLAANVTIRFVFSQNEPPPAPSPFAFEEEPRDNELFGPFFELIAGIAIQVSLIAGVFKLGWGRSFRAWLPTLIPGAVVAVFFLYVVRPFGIETYKIPTNSMAPTVLGKHWVGTCSKCGGAAYGKPWDEESKRRERYHKTICENFHLNTGENFQEESISGDRILAMKFLKPRRWDIVVFHPPDEPTLVHVKRLVGLPGEEVVIDEGVVWIDGERADPPSDLEGIEYLLPMQGGYMDTWGSKERPAVLGEGEYFVLGDFSISSLDSRYFTPSYAVPEENIIGVVTHRYWPPSRCGILR